MKRALLIALIAAVSIAAVAVANTSSDGVIDTGSNEGSFNAECTFSHTLPDDPIVFPRGPGASHQHDFFGSRGTNAFSTNESIRAAGTSCIRHNTPWKDMDRAAYWVPTLYVNDQPVRARLSVRYVTGSRNAADVRPFPVDFKMIVGDSKGVTPGGTAWRCEGATQAPPEGPGLAPTCAASSPSLIVEPRFPDCWDGVNSDSPDHKSHVAFSTKRAGHDSEPYRVCPAGHPVLLPQIEATFRYPTTAGPTTRLSSGDFRTAHADFMNGWQQDLLEGLVRRCLDIGEYCGGGDAPVVGHGPGI